jgi:hypothetical protein
MRKHLKGKGHGTKFGRDEKNDEGDDAASKAVNKKRKRDDDDDSGPSSLGFAAAQFL